MWRQVLAVTHNPVIAAAADRHFVVSKAAAAAAAAADGSYGDSSSSSSGGGAGGGGGYAPQRSTVREVGDRGGPSSLSRALSSTYLGPYLAPI